MGPTEAPGTKGGGSEHREGHSCNTCSGEPWKPPLVMLMARYGYFCSSLPFSNLSSSFRFSATLVITVLVILLQKHLFFSRGTIQSTIHMKKH